MKPAPGVSAVMYDAAVLMAADRNETTDMG
jgi:hypothetical protein